MASLVAPSFNFVGSSASSLAAKRVLRPEEFRPHYTPLTAPLEIYGITLSRQTLVAPAGAGDISIGFDADGDYVTRSGFPYREDIEPDGLECMGAVEWPGPRFVLRDFAEPMIYTPGTDLIVAAPEHGISESSTPVQLYVGFRFKKPTGYGRLPGIVYAKRTNNTAPGGAMPCYRSWAGISTGGGSMRVYMSAREQGLVLIRAGVGVQAVSGNMVAVPKPLTWGGATNLTLGPWRGVWSDPVALATTAGMAILVDLCIGGAWSFRDPFNAQDVGAPSWYSDTDSHAYAAMQGVVGYQPTRTHCVEYVQVLP